MSTRVYVAVGEYEASNYREIIVQGNWHELVFGVTFERDTFRCQALYISDGLRLSHFENIQEYLEKLEEGHLFRDIFLKGLRGIPKDAWIDDCDDEEDAEILKSIGLGVNAISGDRI